MRFEPWPEADVERFRVLSPHRAPILIYCLNHCRALVNAVQTQLLREFILLEERKKLTYVFYVRFTRFEDL